MLIVFWSNYSFCGCIFGYYESHHFSPEKMQLVKMLTLFSYFRDPVFFLFEFYDALHHFMQVAIFLCTMLVLVLNSPLTIVSADVFGG